MIAFGDPVFAYRVDGSDDYAVRVLMLFIYLLMNLRGCVLYHFLLPFFSHKNERDHTSG